MCTICDSTTTPTCTLSLHDALPISFGKAGGAEGDIVVAQCPGTFAHGHGILAVRRGAVRIGGIDDASLAAVAESRGVVRSEEHTSELQSRGHLVCRLLLEKKKIIQY